MTLPRFSLRLLLVAVAVLCAWLAWERSVVIRRRVALDRWARSADSVFWVGKNPNPGAPGPPEVTWIRKLLGDLAIDSVSISTANEQAEFDLAQRLFPEAKVQWAMIRGEYPDNVFPLPSRDHGLYLPLNGRPVLIEPAAMLPFARDGIAPLPLAFPAR